MDKRYRGPISLALASCLLAGCPAPSPSSPTPVQHSTPRVETLSPIRDSKQVEALAASIIPGAEAPKGYSGLFGLKSESVQAAILAPDRWVHPTVPQIVYEPPDIVVMIISVPAESASKGPLIDAKLREALRELIHNPWCDPGLVQPWVIELGGQPYTGTKVQGIDIRGKHNLEYQVDIDRPGQRKVFLRFSGLSGFEGYFPERLMLEFLNKLPPPMPSSETPAEVEPATSASPQATPTH